MPQMWGSWTRVVPDVTAEAIAEIAGPDFPQMEPTDQVEEQIAERDKVLSRFVWSGTHQGEFLGIPATHRPIRVWGMVIGFSCTSWVRLRSSREAGFKRGSWRALLVSGRKEGKRTFILLDDEKTRRSEILCRHSST